MRALFVMIALVGTGGACAAAADPTKPQPGAGATEANSEEISIKETESAEVVYLIHVGPYWTVGPKFAELREYMLAHNQPGPIYARYLDGPGEVPAGSLRTEVGFFVQGEHQPEPPFAMAERMPELVATMFVDRPFATVSRHYSVLRRWAAGHDYAPAGPVTEVYALPVGPEAEARPTEVQMAIVKVEAPVVEEEPVAVPPNPDMPDIPQHADKFVEAEPTSAEAALGIALDDGEAEDLTERAGAPWRMLGVDGFAEEDSAPTSASIDVHDEPAPPARAGVAESGVAEPPVASPPAVERPVEPEQPEAVSPVVLVAALVQQRQFDRVAEQLLPDDRVRAPQFEVWLGQVVYRVTAITGALRRRGESEGQDLIALGDAIERRYQLVSRGFHADPLSQPAWRVDPRSDPQAQEKRSIMRALELMMGRLGVGSLDASASLDEIVEILQRVQNVIQAE